MQKMIARGLAAWVLASSAADRIGTDPGGSAQRRRDARRHHHVRHGLVAAAIFATHADQRRQCERLQAVWNLSLDNSGNASSQPLVIGGTMYVASHTHTIAVDPVTGRQKWKTPIELPADIAGYLCCGIQSRGMAALDGVLYRTTIDAQVMAISMADGKTLWRQKAAEYKDGYTMTHAPLIAGGVLITGISGGEYGSRGFLDGWDLKTGEKKWHRWTTAAPGEPGGDTWKGDAYKTGGAPTWLTGTYDPELDLVYWGTGNGGPWNPATRGGDSLYIGSVLALKPSTGEIVWHYQFSPGDPYDYDGTNELVLADLPIGGKPTKVLMQANRNGFFYVLDRTSGKLISANQFARKVNWATGIDMATGRPIDTPMTAMVRKTEEMKDFIEVWPSAFGGKNWMPMSYDPERKLVFLNSIDLGMKIKYVKQERPGGPNWYLGLELGGFVAPEDGNRGALVAWDPVAGKAGVARAEQVAVLVGRACPPPAAWSSPARRTASSWPSTRRPATSCGRSRRARASPACRSPGSATAAST